MVDTATAEPRTGAGRQVPLSSAGVAIRAGRLGLRPARLRSRRFVAMAAVGLLLAAAAVVLHLLGLRIFVVESPSMGAAAPVGTAVVTAPVRIEDLRLGDVVSFRPPTDRSVVYTHRVASVAPAGSISTRGDINGDADPWTLDQHDLIGRAELLLPAVGWMLRALPLLVGGALAVLLLSALLPVGGARQAARVLGLSVVVSAVATGLRPFAAVEVLTTERRGAAADVLLVSTGMLPVRAQVRGGGFADLGSGEVARIPLTVRADGHYTIATELHLPPWGWALLCMVWLIPLLWVLVIGVPDDSRARAA